MRSGGDTVTIGEWLQAKRREHGLRQEDLAEQLGITRIYLSRLENDHERPSADLLRAALLRFGDDGRDIRQTVDLTDLINVERGKVARAITRLLSTALGEGCAATRATAADALCIMGDDAFGLSVSCLTADWLCLKFAKEAGQWKLTGLDVVTRGGRLPQAEGLFAVNLIDLRAALGIDLAETNAALELSGIDLAAFVAAEGFYAGKDDSE